MSSGFDDDFDVASLGSHQSASNIEAANILLEAFPTEGDNIGAPGNEPVSGQGNQQSRQSEDETSIADIAYPVQPDVVKFVQVPKTHVNHTYRNFTNMPMTSYTLPASVHGMTFHEKVYHLLTNRAINCRRYIEWCCRGRAFAIREPKDFEQSGSLLCYFGHSSMARLRKDLVCYGYKRLTSGKSNEDWYYSEFLLRGMPHLLQYSPPFKKRRKLLPDPENEPNFDQIALLYPLPGDRRAVVAEARRRLEARGFVISDAVFEFVASSGSSPAATSNPDTLPPGYRQPAP